MEYYSNYSFLIEDVTICVTMVSYRKFKRILPMHCHGENIYEIHYVTEGEGQVILNETNYEISKDILYVTGPNVFHEQISNSDNPIAEFGIYLHVDTIKSQGTIMSSFCEKTMWVGSARKEMRHLMEQIILEHEGKYLGWENKVSLLLSEFVIECVRSYETTLSYDSCLPKPKEVFFTHDIKEENAQLVMDEMILYEYKEICLESLAERLGFSARQTQRFIQKSYGKSFSEKKLEARMLAAVTMLSHTNMKITDISENLGYSSVEHFSNAFSKYYGKSPREYRRE